MFRLRERLAREFKMEHGKVVRNDGIELTVLQGVPRFVSSVTRRLS